jgi:hypothetical protein
MVRSRLGNFHDARKLTWYDFLRNHVVGVHELAAYCVHGSWCFDTRDVASSVGLVKLLGNGTGQASVGSAKEQGSVFRNQGLVVQNDIEK